MRLEKVHLKGFRNFDDAEITFQKKALVIGANDVGKTNLIYALRLLFDKTISERDLDLSESDYNAFSGTDKVEITVSFCEITEECLLGEFSGAIKDGRLVIRYTNSKSGSYMISAGYDESVLTEISRKYLKRLNMQYVDTNRNLFAFLGHERMRLLQMSKEKRSEEQEKEDTASIEFIQENLNSINGKINSLNYISAALEEVNHELGELSVHNEDQSVSFVAGESNADNLLDNLTLSYSATGNQLTLGGDGRNNQIFLATWIAKQHIQRDIDHVTFYAIEEPEAHLHPHQQRKLSRYIQNSFDDQIIVTTHSPQIVSKFSPSNIIRLFPKNKFSFAACGGCSEALRQVIESFGYRLNALSSEVFFADGVFLVEGTSEVLLYTALAEKLSIDLDRHNITILSVEGVGFKPYVAVCNALCIPCVLRTDNDIFTKQKKGETYNFFAGISRVIGIVDSCFDKETTLLSYWKSHETDNEWEQNQTVPQSAIQLNTYVREAVKKIGIFISDIDLENDLAKSPLKDALYQYYGAKTEQGLVASMQAKKAENMLSFITSNRDNLTSLNNDPIMSPLMMLVSKVKERAKPDDK